MFKNYFKIALRNLIRQKVFSSINIFGLAVGMACTILILLWVQDELSFDRFHKNAENIYLVLRGDSKEFSAVTSILLAPALKDELPEVANSTSFMPLPESMNILIQNGNNGFEENVSVADSNFFKMFSFIFRKGNPATALADPNSIVITEEIEKKYFGEEDALGKSLRITAFGKKYVMNVSGVLENMPFNSQIQGKIIIPASWFQSIVATVVGSNFDYWDNQSWQTYIQLKNQCDIQELSLKIKACEISHHPNQNAQTLNYSLLPLTKIHLYGNGIKFFRVTGDIKYVQIFIAIAIIILLIASINYMNLSTALSLKRTKEVGIKKTVGADRKTLMLQFFGESLLISCIALGFAVLLVWLFLPEFNHLSGKKLAIRYDEPYFISITFLITLLTGIISGCYPALFISSFQPIQILKGKLKLSSGSLYTRKGLVVFQFALSTIMIICTIVVFNQLSFIRNRNLGLDKENIICIRMMGDANSKYDVLKNELQKNSDLLSISRSESINSAGWGKTGGVYWEGKQNNEEKRFWMLNTDYDLESTFKIEMSQGRFFSKQYPTDQTNAFVINEAAAKSMGMKSPLNEDIQLWTGKKGKIIGVTKDFHFASLHTAVEPLIITFPKSSEQNLFYRILSIRVKSGTLYNSLAFIEKTWKEQMTDISLDYYFYDESLNAQYSADQRMGTIFKYFAFLSIVISCLGLFGLASLSAEQRTKEIGIRKVLGASTTNITLNLSKEFLIWIIASNIVAWPIAYYFMNRWLQDFAYRINIEWWVFFLAGFSALAIALLTVGYQAVRAAMANLVESLRYE
ncbi:MAG: ABC transporter permease [Bacteroidota bacterium]|jgi:ABC-type antimicrobial peptide transport system permease subunit